MEKNDKKKAALLRLKKMKYYVRRFGLLKAGGKILLPTVTAMALNISNLSAQEKQDFVSGDEFPAYDFPDNNNDLLAYERKVVFDLDSEIDRRADWFVGKFLESARYHLNALEHTSNKKGYIKKNFFDVVSPHRNLPGSTPYCITALNRALIDANSISGDLDGILPNPNTNECYSANECNAFAQFLRSKGFGDCIDEGTIDFTTLEEGDILLTVRNKAGNRHARQYIGKRGGVHYCLNFNIDGIRELKNTSAIVIHIKQIARKAIIRNLERADLMPDMANYHNNIMPLFIARRLHNYLYRGRDDTQIKNTNASDIAYNASPEDTFLMGISLNSKRRDVL
ncbi:MAG: hypothetical protein IJ689_02510 [Alphaproteobacteria bacterium]|nr:hypothetical protein [Alphaproteobacteria bacterium]